jgi:uracil-DNA glycosylase
MAADKERRLKNLVKKRRLEVYRGYRCIGSFRDGKYDCDFVVPWSKSACNVNADLMIIAQDWASQKFLEEACDQSAESMERFGYDKTLETNRELHKRLEEQMGLKFSQTYATDVFPFIKPGRMSARIPIGDLKKAATDYALPQIEIVSPHMVVCLGIGTFNAICAALAEKNGQGKTRRLSWGDYEDKRRVVTKYEQTEIYAVTHLGARGKIKRRKKIGPEWTTLARRLSELCAGSRD